MRPSAHFSTGLLIWFFLSSIQKPLSLTNTFFLIIGVVFLDLDMIGKIFSFEKNHRRYFTHSPLFWTFVIVLSYLLLIDSLIWFSLGCLIHIFLDFFDWGIPYLPTKNSRLFPHLLNANPTINSEKYFANIYWNNLIILSIELLLFLVSLIILLIISIDPLKIVYFYLFVLIFLLTYFLSGYDYVNSKKALN